MVLADSHRIPRAPCYSGNTVPDTHQPVPPTGVSPTTPRLPRRFSYRSARTRSPAEDHRTAPQPRTRNPCRVSHAHGLTIIRFRSPLLTEYLLLRVLRCFTSPRNPPRPMNSGEGDRAQPRPGPPIRTPSDHSPSAGSPRLIAGHHVLHRPPMPRHPPNAHNNEHTQTSSQSRHTRHATTRTRPITNARDRRAAHDGPPPPAHPHPTKKGENRKGGGDGRTGGGPRTTKHQHRNPSNPTTRARRSFTYYRCSRPLCSSQPTRPPTRPTTRDSRPAGQGRRHQGALPQTPTACHPTTRAPTRTTHPTTGQARTNRPTSSRQPHPSTQAPRHNDRTPTSPARPVSHTTALHQPGPPTSRPATLPAPGTSQHSRPNKRAP